MLAVTLYNPRQHEQKMFGDGVVRLGKNPNADGTNFEGITQQCMTVNDPLIADHQFEIYETTKNGQPAIELINVGRSSLALSSGRRIHRGTVATLSLPVTFSVGDSHMQIFVCEESKDASDPVGCLSGITFLNNGQDGSDRNTEASSNCPSPAADTLAAWLDMLSELQQAVAGSKELYELAARAIFNPGGLDGGMILLPANGGWEIAASYIPYPDNGLGFRKNLVDHAATIKQTIYHQPKSHDDDSFNELHSAVVCPVVGDNDEVVAAVYGFRSTHRLNSRRGIRVLESQFVKVVADSLSAAMIRLAAEADAARSTVLLNQAFSPNVARQLQANPTFLNAQSREVTVLFADLRGFSTISEQVGSLETYELLADIMDRFTNVVTDLDGVVIDFYGDGISAFWNAPITQPEHAAFACQAGLEMLAYLPELNEIWEDRIGCKLKLGVGIHTGEACVGNAGSRTRLKYGPRGNTVNLASRLETSTKELGVPMVVSGDTARHIQGAFKLRRLTRSMLKGITQPTDVFQVLAASETVSDEVLEAYDKALCQFENGNLTESLVSLTKLKLDAPNDPATDFLLRLVAKEKQNSIKHPSRRVADLPLITSPVSPNWKNLLSPSAQ
ncbi:MAG: adenylate/guanylate cyclase domain-containing protein [Mariniblastus sp.]